MALGVEQAHVDRGHIGRRGQPRRNVHRTEVRIVEGHVVARVLGERQAAPVAERAPGPERQDRDYARPDRNGDGEIAPARRTIHVAKYEPADRYREGDSTPRTSD